MKKEGIRSQFLTANPLVSIGSNYSKSISLIYFALSILGTHHKKVVCLK